MKTVFAILLAIAMVGLVGCTTTQKRVTYNSIHSTVLTVNTAYAAYNDLVLTGKISGADYAKVARAYADFQSAASLAIAAARFNPQSPPPGDLIAAAAKVTELTGGAK